MKEFLFGHQNVIDIVGWHVALLLAFCIGWLLTHLHHHKYQSHRCVRFDCKRRLTPVKK